MESFVKVFPIAITICETMYCTTRRVYESQASFVRLDRKTIKCSLLTSPPQEKMIRAVQASFEEILQCKVCNEVTIRFLS